MPGVPQRLQDWNLQVLRGFIAAGQFETDSFDFKEVLIANPKGGDSYRQSLTKTACAFANTRGGFFVFGVKDAQSSSSAEDRLRGIPYSSEFAKQFGDQVATAEPTLYFVPQNPPIMVPETDKVVFVVHVPRGLRGPHMTRDGLFYKRTNAGNARMSYQ